MNFFRLSSCQTWKILSPVSPGNETAWILTGPPVYSADLLYPAVSWGESVIRLSLGKLLVNLLQVVKRTNTPLIPYEHVLQEFGHPTPGRFQHDSQACSSRATLWQTTLILGLGTEQSTSSQTFCRHLIGLRSVEADARVLYKEPFGGLFFFFILRNRAPSSGRRESWGAGGHADVIR